MKSTIQTKDATFEVSVSGPCVFLDVDEKEQGSVEISIRPEQALDLAALLRSAADIAVRRRESYARGDV